MITIAEFFRKEWNKTVNIPQWSGNPSYDTQGSPAKTTPIISPWLTKEKS